MTGLRTFFRSGALVTALITAAAPSASADDLNDYPTSARAEYVFGCMKANGETQEILQKCSCSVAVGSEFRSTEPAKLALQEFRRAQAEAEVRCF